LKLLPAYAQSTNIYRKEPQMTPRKPTKPPSRGELLVDAIRSEMDGLDLIPTASEEALLRLACDLADRLDRLERVVEREGELLTAANGTVRMHPGAVECRQIAMALARVLAGVVVAETDGAKKDPAKVRAATSRWRAHNLSKTEQAGA
jgi:hypothetical protein